MARGKKNARRRKAWIVFLDESGLSERPPIRSTWAPRGQTPILRVSGSRWSKLSIAGAIAYRWDGRKARFFFQTVPGDYDTAALVSFLEQLQREMRHRPIILIWDNLGVHKSTDMGRYLAGQLSIGRVTQLPSYAPELNPVEMIWSVLKGRPLANFCPKNFAELEAAALAALRGFLSDSALAFAALRHADLSL